MAGGAGIFAVETAAGALGSALGAGLRHFAPRKPQPPLSAKATGNQDEQAFLRAYGLLNLLHDPNWPKVQVSRACHADQCARTIETWIWPRVRKTSSETLVAIGGRTTKVDA